MIGFLLKRPVAVIMSTIAFLVLGAVAMFQLPVSLMPDVDIPEISIHYTQDNASVNEMENSITNLLRGSCNRFRHYRTLLPIQGRERNDNHEVRIRHFDRLCFYRGQSESGCCDEQLP